MYKSQLQELCQKRGWLLPEYHTSVTGQSHVPRFLSTVTVNGLKFDSPDEARSSKQSQSDAAQLAYAHFTTTTSSQSPTPVAISSSTPAHVVGSSGGNTALCNGNGTFARERSPEHMGHCGSLAPSVLPIQTQAENVDLKRPIQDTLQLDDFKKPRSPKTYGNDECVVNGDHSLLIDSPLLSKSSLQTYCVKHNLPPPIYDSERSGPPHDPRFKCKVTFNGKTYESQKYFRSLKEAEQDSANLAMMTLTSSGKLVDDTIYKNLLQEYCQRESSPLPVYKTSSSGAAHLKMFVSSVEVKGKAFKGQAAKTKKAAEMFAAKNAYLSLKCPGESQECGSHANVVAYFQQNVQPEQCKTRSSGEKAAMEGMAINSSIKQLLDRGFCCEGVIIHPRGFQVSVPEGAPGIWH